MKIFTLFFSFLLISQISLAQEHCTNKKYQKIQKEKLIYLKTELQLTSHEEKVFLPIFTEFENKRVKLHQEKHKLMRDYEKNGLNMSDKDLLEIADRFVEIDVEMAKLEKNYHEKFKKVLSPVKLLLLYRSERKFKMRMIKKMKHGIGMSHKME